MSRRLALALVLVLVGFVAAYFLLRKPDAPAVEAGAPTKADAGAPQAPKSASVRDDREPGVTLAGRVVATENEAAIAGAVIVLRRHVDESRGFSGERVRTLASDAGGEFAFDEVAPGSWAISATAPGRLPAVVRRIDVGAGASEPVVLRLATGGVRVHGTVADITGGTIEGALVRAEPMGGLMALRELEGFGTLTDGDGTYALSVAAGRYRIVVSHPDYAAQERGIEVGAGEIRQDFELVPTGTIEGVVVEESGGAPVAGARVNWFRERMLALAGGTRQAMRAEGGVVVADDQGRFTIRGLDPGLVSLSARASKRASVDVVTVPVAIAEHVTGVEVPVVAAYDVGGRVLDGRDPSRGVAGASVQLDGRGEGAMAVADAEGRFVLEGVLEGRYMAIANAQGYGFTFPGVDVQVQGDRDDLEMRLDPGLRIAGRVEPPTIAQISLDMSPDSVQQGAGMIIMSAGASVETKEDGTFELGPVAPGKAIVVARVADGRGGQTEVEVGPDGADDVVVQLEPRVRVRGTVTGTDGEPVAQAGITLTTKRADGRRMRLTINGRDMGTESSVTADDGSFEILGVREGEYEVTLVDRFGDALPVKSGNVPISDDTPVLDVSKSDRDGVSLVVDAHRGVISGTVKSDDGAPAGDVWVTLTRQPDPIVERPADEEPREESHHEMRVQVRGTSSLLGSAERPPVLTDEDGRFEFAGLRDGRYTVVAELGGGRSRTSADAVPGDRVALTLAPLAKVEGEVTMNGKPLKDFTVALAGPTTRTVRVRDSGGHYEVDRLDPGTYSISVRTEKGSGTGSFSVEAGKTAEHDVVLNELATVVGTIVDAGGAPVEGAMVLMGDGSVQGRVKIEADGSEGLITTDAEGKFESKVAGGARVLVGIRPGDPTPLVIKFFAAEAGERVDLGTLDPNKDGPPSRGGPPPGEGAPEGKAEPEAKAVVEEE